MFLEKYVCLFRKLIHIFAPAFGRNVLKNFEEDLGKTGERL